MNICSDNHVEICHEGTKCPICELIETMIRDNLYAIGKLEDTIISLIETIAENID